MKTSYKNETLLLKRVPYWLVLFLVVQVQFIFAQPATVSNPMAIGQNCGGGGNNFKTFNYDTTTRKLTQIGSNCNPSLQSPGFNPGGGSIAFSPKDQKLYYIETTNGSNSIIWNWTPGTCPVSNQPYVYYYSGSFIVGLEFNTITGDGYQLEFSNSGSPYSVYLRKVTSFSPLTVGAAQQIIFPAGKNIYQQNGDIVITPTGNMYFVLDNKMFNLDYSTYGTSALNAGYIDTLKNGAGNSVIGLSYSNGKFITSVSNSGSTCFYNQVDISSGAAVQKSAAVATGTFVAYDMATMVTGIGAAKKLSSLSKTGPFTYQVTYDIKVKNYGNENLTSVQLVDSVAAVFGTAFFNASVAAIGSLPSGLTLNPFFNGSTNAKIFSAGGTLKATPSDSAIVRLTVNLINPNLSHTYLNSAIATATGSIFSNVVRDSSDNQALLNPDVSGTDVPDLKGEDVPTPLTPAMWLLLDNNIINFNALQNGAINSIQWTLDNQAVGTISILQRSKDGINFENMANLKSKVLSRQEYSWQDTHPLSANNYYRLQVSSPGSVKVYSGTVLIRKPEVPVIVTVAPNPFMQSLKFTLHLDKAVRINYRILDYVSAVLQTGQYDGHIGQNEVDVYNLGNIPAGANILEVIVGEKHYFQKIVKLK